MVEFDINELTAMVAAVICGSLVGLEREIHGKPAGLRTNILICLGSALFTIVAREMAAELGIEQITSRVAQGIISGIGFLGAGAIIQDRAGIQGLTTAAGIWVVAGLGITCGAGMYMTAFIAVILTLAVLWIMHPLAVKLRKKTEKNPEYEEKWY